MYLFIDLIFHPAAGTMERKTETNNIQNDLCKMVQLKYMGLILYVESRGLGTFC